MYFNSLQMIYIAIALRPIDAACSKLNSDSNSKNYNNSEIEQYTFIITIRTAKLQLHTLHLFITKLIIGSITPNITAAYKAIIMVLSTKA